METQCRIAAHISGPVMNRYRAVAFGYRFKGLIIQGYACLSAYCRHRVAFCIFWNPTVWSVHWPVRRGLFKKTININ
jgi:hypothetical protein